MERVPGALRAAARVLLGLALLVFAAASPASSQEGGAFPVSVTDVAGRAVTIPERPQRIALGEGVQVISLALLDPQALSRLVLVGADLGAYDPGTEAALVEAFPALGSVPTARDEGSGLPFELVLAAKPDLVVFSLWQKPRVEALVGQLEALGIPVLFTDFFEAPVENTPASMRLLGRALGRQEAGESYAALFEERLAAVRAAVAGRPARSLILNAFPATWACCWAQGSGGFGAFLPIAGGRNIAEAAFPDALGGALALEYVLAADPDVYVATGLSAPGDGLRLGGGIDEAQAQAGLGAVVAAEPIAGFRAVREGRAHGLWNWFNGTPLNILALEALATWLHPETAAMLGPAATRATIEERFLGRPLPGTFWTSLAP